MITVAEKVPRGTKPKSAPTKDKKGFKPGVELARQAFVYGLNGEFITSTAELAKLGGVSEATIWKYTKEWQGEREQLLAASSKVGSSVTLSVDPKNTQINDSDISFIRKRMDEIKYQTENLESIIDVMEGMLQAVSDFQDKPDVALGLFDKYLRFHMNKKSLVKEFLDLKAVWNKEVGIDSLRAVAEATTKAVSIAASKGEPSPEQSNAGQGGAGVFRLK